MNASISGKATMGTVTDVEPLLRSLLLEQKRKAGTAGAVTADELTAAAAAFGDDVDQHAATTAAEVQELMQRSLPAGVRVEKVAATRSGTRVTSSTTFAFDDIRLLRDLEMFYERGQKSHRPFAHLAFVEGAGELVVDGMPPAFTGDVDALAGIPDEELAKSAVTLELEVALPVVDHNATRTEGQRLVWEIDGRRLRAQTSDASGWIHVKYRRS